MRTRIFSAIIATLCLWSAQAQSVKKLMEKAELAFYREQFPSAILQYDAILQKNPKHTQARYHQLIAQHLTTSRGKDMSELLAFEDSKGHSDKFYNYWMGRVHLLRYEFELAQRHFEAFLDMNTYRSKEIQKETSDFVDLIKVARSYYEKPSDFELEQLDYPINSVHADLSPGYFNDHNELVFTSSRPSDSWQKSPQDFLVFHTLKENSEQWSQPTILANIGILPQQAPKVEVVNDDGKLFIFKNKDGGDLFFSRPSEYGWTMPQEFDSKIKSTKLESDFFINDQENKILFASKRGRSGLDIYESNLNNDGTWSTPKPISGGVNTDFDEDSPFLSRDGQTLYFSSNRPNSMGGFDIFQSRYNTVTKIWSEPVNLGFPINTIDDEINFQLQEDQLSGFLSSNRLHSLGDFDIYYFHKEGQAKLDGYVKDENGEAVPFAVVKYHPEIYLDESFTVVTDGDGYYQLQLFANESYTVEVWQDVTKVHEGKFRTTIEGHRKMLQNDLNIRLPDTQNQVDFASLYDASSDESQEELNMLGSKFRAGQKAVIRNIYFAPGSSSLNMQEAAPIIDQIVEVLNEFPSLRLEVGGHTDNLESPSNRSQVSLSRAEMVKQQLLRLGIADNRLTTKGYGDMYPLSTNDDEEDGRELNRRIEVRVIE